MCADADVAVQTIKGVARRRWPEEHSGPRFSWYEPLDDADAIGRATRWVLANPQVFLVTSSDVRVIPTVVDAVERGGGAPTDAEMETDVGAFGIEPLFDGGTLERI